jgi:cytochrome P450
MAQSSDAEPRDLGLRITDDHGDLLLDVLEDPYALYERLRVLEPVHFDDALRGWMLTRYAEVEAAVVDPRLSAARTQAYLSELPSVDRDRFKRFADTRSDMLLFCEGPKHARLRRAVRKAIAAAGTEAEGIARRTINQLLDDLGGTSTIDLITDFALPLPITVLVELLGIPRADAPLISHWATIFNVAIGGVIDSGLVAAADLVIDDLWSYLEGLIRDELAPSSVLASLKQSVAEGELADSELLASCLMLVTAGHETTTNLIGNALHALSSHPDQLAWLREDLRRVRGALDEILRYDAPVQLTARQATERLEIAGREIPKCARVIPMWGAANRDPSVFENPADLQLQRPESRRNLSFGSGRHRCLGASIARIEGELAIRAVLQRFGRLVPIEAPEWKPNFSFRGLRHLVVAVDQ